ncbi:MAG: hypothetical protein P4N59_16615 [Negativicutes bacterium]|nr:hypothetical protein [Negativicutes bacterium]
MDTFWKSLRNTLKKLSLLLALNGAVIGWILSYVFYLSGESYTYKTNFAMVVGTACFTAGIFSAVIFADIIRRVIVRQDVPACFYDIGTPCRYEPAALHNRRFDEVKEEMGETTDIQYPPSPQPSCRENQHYNLLIDLIDDDTLSVVEETRYTLKGDNGKTPLIYSSWWIGQTEECCGSLTDLVVNEVSVFDRLDEPALAKCLSGARRTYEYPLGPDPAYRIEERAQIRQHLSVSNAVSYQSSAATKNLYVNILLGNRLKMEFFNAGVSQSFIEVPNILGIIQYKYEGLLLPNQGFILTFQKRANPQKRQAK